MIEINKAAGQSGPFDNRHYDFRGIAAYCKEKRINPLDMTIREFNRFAMDGAEDKRPHQTVFSGMNDLLEYKGYLGSVEFSAADHVLFGEVIGIRSLISYEGSSLEALRKDFETSVDAYLACCAQPESHPEKVSAISKPEIQEEWRKTQEFADKIKVAPYEEVQKRLDAISAETVKMMDELLLKDTIRRNGKRASALSLKRIYENYVQIVMAHSLVANGADLDIIAKSICISVKELKRKLYLA